jgi:hypothetical protein
MSGSNFSTPGSVATPAEGLSFTVHSMPAPVLGDERRTRTGRFKMLAILAVCAAPVVASYLTYFVIRPEGRSNYGELIEPQRALPADLPLVDLHGAPVKAAALKGQWLLIAVGGGACDAGCEKSLYVQRQVREALGRDRERLDKVWLVTDAQPVRPEVLNAISMGTPAHVLRVPSDALAQWLAPTAGQSLERHLYIVDPMGHWMMRFPSDPQPAKLKRDIEKLLRASASWDLPGR